jgi:hypothetical protein
MFALRSMSLASAVLASAFFGSLRMRLRASSSRSSRADPPNFGAHPNPQIMTRGFTPLRRPHEEACQGFFSLSHDRRLGLSALGEYHLRSSVLVWDVRNFPTSLQREERGGNPSPNGTANFAGPLCGCRRRPPLPTKMKAPGRASSINEKSSAPITGGTSVSTRSRPTTSAATAAANAVCGSVVAGHGIVALVGELGLRAVEAGRPLDHF